MDCYFLSGYQDSNLGPPAPKAGALTGLRYIPKMFCCGGLTPPLVGIPGFEPGTPCSQSRCANRTALHPETRRENCCLSHFVAQRYTLFSIVQSF